MFDLHLLAREERPPAAASAWGHDLFGQWIEICVANVVQRLRWVPPGSFWMGSPEQETGRCEDEGPRHRVTISRGFWLGDTACTHTLWLAVVGSKSSSFDSDLDSPKHPVECVSWRDVQWFLHRLREHLPGAEPALPTEAEWEYACRAGTESAFSFGNSLDSGQANFDGNQPYGIGKKGPARAHTVPVGSFAPNAWGLHEMHGQVWEWCADVVPRKYTANPVVDPGDLSEPSREGLRSVRGGSWLNGGRSARSAQRSSSLASWQAGANGFRIALRSGDQGLTQWQRRDGCAPAAEAPVNVSRGWSPGLKELW